MPQALALLEIIEQAQHNDQDAFEKLYKLHKHIVYSLCLRMVRNVEQAEDLTQEAFLQAFRHLNTYRGDAAFSTWLHRVTVNVVLMSLRRKTYTSTSLEELMEPDSNGVPGLQIGADDSRLVGAIDRMTLECAVEELPPGYKIIFILHDIEGYEHNEIADLLGCSLGNSKSQLHKARMRLRAVLMQQRRSRELAEAA